MPQIEDQELNNEPISHLAQDPREIADMIMDIAYREAYLTYLEASLGEISLLD